MTIHSRKAMPYTVTLDGHVAPTLRVLYIETSTGAGADHALLQLDLGRAQIQAGNSAHATLRDVTIPSLLGQIHHSPLRLMNTEVAIYKGGTPGSPQVHLGRIDHAEIGIGEDGEALLLTSRLANTFFGAPLGFQRIFDRPTGTLQYADEPVTFNPQVNGQTVPNRRNGYAGAFTGAMLFVQPLSVMTFAAGFYQQAESFAQGVIGGALGSEPASLWTLAEATAYVLAACNESETWIANPTETEIEVVLGDSRAMLRQHALAPSLYLPEALDALLHPYGYTWKVDYPSPNNPKITLLKMGQPASAAKVLLLQESGSVYEINSTNLAELRVRADISRGPNQIRAVGNFTQVEGTFELMPAWPANLDALSAVQLDRTMPAWKNHPERHRVHREWVLNEDGTYNNLRPGHGQPFDFTPVFRAAFGGEHPPVTPRRRRFLPTLTTRGEGDSPGATSGGEVTPIGEHGGCTIEYFHEPDNAWVPIPAGDSWFGAVQLLTDECGIRFVGDRPPPPMIRAMRNGTARLRITASVVSDTRISATAARQGSSQNEHVHEQVVDVGGSFHARRVARAGGNASLYADGSKYTAVEADARASLASFAEQLRENWDQADIGGVAVIEGLDRMPDYQLGEAISHVAGRDIRFAPTSGGSLCPQIVRRQEQVQEQKLILWLATTRTALVEVLADAAQTSSLRRQRKRTRMPIPRGI